MSVPYQFRVLSSWYVISKKFILLKQQIDAPTVLLFRFNVWNSLNEGRTFFPVNGKAYCKDGFQVMLMAYGGLNYLQYPFYLSNTVSNCIYNHV